MTKYRLYKIECWTEQKWNRRVVHCQRFLCHQHTCDSHSCDIIWHQTGVVSTGWIVTSPKTDPRGTPKTKSIGVDFKPSTITDCVLSLWYDSNQDSATPEIPKVLSSRLNRMAWSRVSKAALSARTDTSSWSDFVRRPSSTLKTAVSVLWYFLYADCLISNKLFAHRLDCSWRRTTLSSIFETNGWSEKGPPRIGGVGGGGGDERGMEDVSTSSPHPPWVRHTLSPESYHRRNDYKTPKVIRHRHPPRLWNCDSADTERNKNRSAA